jgi:uncharacterized protein (DUF2344 family)
MTFTPALSLGVASLTEVLDVKIEAELDPAAILDDLSAGSQPGLRFVAGAKLGPEDPGIARVVNAARYAVGIPRSVAEALGGISAIEDRMAAALQARELIVIRRIEGIGKRVNVREFLRSARLADAGFAGSLSRANIAGDLVALSVEVEIRGSGGVKIAEVVEAVFGDAEIPHRAVRVALGRLLDRGAWASPLDLHQLRSPRSSISTGDAPAHAAFGPSDLCS